MPASSPDSRERFGVKYYFAPHIFDPVALRSAVKAGFDAVIV